MQPIRIIVIPIVVALAACAAARAPAPPPTPPATPLTPTPTPTPTPEQAMTPASPKPPACGRRKPTGCVGPSPSFARDVAPVLEHRCLSCHANGGIAADEHDFSRFATLHAQKNAVLAEVGTCSMPPPQAPTLEPDEADMLLRWAACGAQEN